VSSTPENPETRPIAQPVDPASVAPPPRHADPDAPPRVVPRSGWYDDLYDEAPRVAPPPVETEPGLHAGRHIASAIVCLIVVPAAIGLLAYGGARYQDVVLRPAIEHDVRGVAALAGGAFLLLLVACSGALSPLGPLLSGLVWGLAPAVLFLIAPEDTLDRVDDIPEISSRIEAGLAVWLTFGGFLAVGVALFGAGVTAALRRR
jgi:hypothetical protein